MSARKLTALENRAPFADGAANTPDLRFTSGVAQQQNALPASWNGRMVEITNESVTAGDLVAFHFSFGVARTVTIGAAAAAGDPTVDRGRIIMPGTTRRMRLPANPASSAILFFNRIAAANTPAISIALVEF